METSSAENQKKVLSSISPYKVLIPVAIGILAIIYLIFSNDDISLAAVWEDLKNADLKWIFLAILVLIIRDAGYIYRIRYITNGHLTWKSSTFVILLWEFASSITPSAVGGTAVAVFIMNKEQIPLGKSLAYVMITAVLDNCFFIVAALLVTFFGSDTIFPAMENVLFGWTMPMKTIFYVSVSLIAMYTLIMVYGLLINPKGFRWVITKVGAWPILRRWQKNAEKIGDDVLNASKELSGMKAIYWVRAIISTVFVWSARYLMLNCLIAAFTTVSAVDLGLTEHGQIFSRQVVMWITLLISPTPGSTGIAEVVFPMFFLMFLGGKKPLAFGVAILWRLFTYYTYLLIGVLVLPRWVTKIVQRSAKNEVKEQS